MDDSILRMYIDEVFSYYDHDRSGTLDKRELVGFFNQLFQSFNDPRRVDQNTVNQMLAACDMNRDGQVSKPELFTVFKRVLMGDSSVYPTSPQQQYGQHGQYGQGPNAYQQNQGGNQYQPNQGNQYQQYQGGSNNPQNQGNMGNQLGYQMGNQYSQPSNAQYGNQQYAYQGTKNLYQQPGPRYN